MHAVQRWTCNCNSPLTHAGNLLTLPHFISFINRTLVIAVLQAAKCTPINTVCVYIHVYLHAAWITQIEKGSSALEKGTLNLWYWWLSTRKFSLTLPERRCRYQKQISLILYIISRVINHQWQRLITSWLLSSAGTCHIPKALLSCRNYRRDCLLA